MYLLEEKNLNSYSFEPDEEKNGEDDDDEVHAGQGDVQRVRHSWSV